MATPRWVVANFSQSPAPTGSRVSAVLLYVISLDPALASPITSVSLLVRAQGSVVTVAVPVYLASNGGNSTTTRSLACPALNRLAVNSSTLVIAGSGLGLASFRASTVVGVRVDVTSAAVANKQQLPQVAAIGLQLA
ncbi:hypothetical protein GPECTOR_106g123 [Gonium pectorale]|uniref:Uncharacterized protein n=1 Tax=Gonium pectorale TaxID=33097 RepID=A0A150FZL6_GONPE|nr:hypothetical protein GPECTOR_106g123 [Gonium pectorale]|eukprot:KXZ43029.1 hypothetical protein GPECTOR_106g123 [Gonium pectorale]